MLTFTIPGKPQPKQRPRFSKGRTYTAKDTALAEKRIKQIAHLAMMSEKQKPFEGAVGMTVTFYVERKQTATPDIDNLVKTVGDAVNGVVYKDDAQVVMMTAEKFQDKDNPRTIVSIYSMANKVGRVWVYEDTSKAELSD